MKKVILLLAVGALAIPLGSASAELIDLRTLVSGKSSLIHHWTFEGATDAAQMQNKKSGVHLSRVTAGFTAGWVPGFGGDGWAARTYRGATASEGGAYQSGSFTPPSAGTVEYLFNPIDATKFAGHYISSASGGRFYAGLFNLGEAGVGFGTEGWDAPFAPYLTGSTTPDLQANHWYYVAVTYERSGTTFTFDAYLADLTEGEKTLTHAISNATRTGTSSLGSSPLGIGKQSGSATNYFEGYIDEVALYDEQLSAATLQTHLDAIYVPEPGTMMLLGMGGLFLLLGRRRNG